MYLNIETYGMMNEIIFVHAKATTEGTAVFGYA